MINNPMTEYEKRERQNGRSFVNHLKAIAMGQKTHSDVFPPRNTKIEPNPNGF